MKLYININIENIVDHHHRVEFRASLGNALPKLFKATLINCLMAENAFCKFSTTKGGAQIVFWDINPSNTAGGGMVVWVTSRPVSAKVGARRLLTGLPRNGFGV